MIDTERILYGMGEATAKAKLAAAKRAEDAVIRVGGEPLPGGLVRVGPEWGIRRFEQLIQRAHQDLMRSYRVRWQYEAQA